MRVEKKFSEEFLTRAPSVSHGKQALIACEAKKIAERGQNIGRAYDIVMELNNTLDHKIGGEISKNLEQLYVFFMDLYTKANISGDPAHLQSRDKDSKIFTRAGCRLSKN